MAVEIPLRKIHHVIFSPQSTTSTTTTTTTTAPTTTTTTTTITTAAGTINAVIGQSVLLMAISLNCDS